MANVCQNGMPPPVPSPQRGHNHEFKSSPDLNAVEDSGVIKTIRVRRNGRVSAQEVEPGFAVLV
jgi:hypothetical protein